MRYLEFEWTDEEAVEQMTARDQQISDLTAERDSLTERNTSLLEQMQKLQAEIQETKKLNFTLASQINMQKNVDPTEEFFKEVLKS